MGREQNRTEQTKYALKSTKKLYKISSSLICGHQQPINYKVWLLWIQEATGEVWIGLEQNVIDAAINEWRKCLRAEPMFVGQHFKHRPICRQLKMDN